MTRDELPREPGGLPDADARAAGVRDRRPSKAHPLAFAGTVRGLIITYGIGAYLLLLRYLNPGSAPFGQSSRNLILFGLGLQVLRWVALWLLARYGKERGLKGVLAPSVMYRVDLVIDGMTVLLFALATFRGIAAVATPG